MNPQDPYEAKLALAIWQALEKLNSLLWDRYKEDFLALTSENEDQPWKSTPSDTADEDYDWESTSSDMEPLNGSPPKDPAPPQT
jgi:hypothetical protein